MYYTPKWETPKEAAKDTNYQLDSNDLLLTNLNTTVDGEIDNGDSLSIGISKILRDLGLLNTKVEENAALTEEEARKIFLSLEDAKNIYVKQEDGKQLSSNDFTDKYKEALDGFIEDTKLSETTDIILTNINSTIDGEIDNGDNLSIAISKLMRDIGKNRNDISTLEETVNELIDESISKDILKLYVEKEDGKQLSSNDFTDKYKEALDGFIEDTKLSETTDIILTNINDTIDGEIDNGDTLSEAISKLMRDIGIQNNKIESNLSSQAEVNSTFATKEELNTYVEKVDGKDLSTNDFTDVDKAKLDSLRTDIPLSSEITLTNINSTIDGEIDNGDNLSEAISKLMRDIGINRNSIAKLADGHDTVISNYATKEELNTYVKKVDGKDLSTNDFTDKYKNMIDDLAAEELTTNDITLININSVTEDRDPDNGDTLSVGLSLLMNQIGRLKQKNVDIVNKLDTVNDTYIDNTELSTKLDQYVKKEEGKGLSTNDFTNTYKNLLDKFYPQETQSISTFAISPSILSNYIILSNLNSVTEDRDPDNGDSLSVGLSILMNQIGKLRDSSTATNNTIINNYYTKEDINNTIKNYVEKIDGKGLSSNDFTNTDKEKLDSLTNTPNSNHTIITNVTNITEEEYHPIVNGDSLTDAINKLIYKDKLLDSTLRDHYWDRGQTDQQYVHKQTGKDLSTNDFTNEYKQLIDQLTGGPGGGTVENKYYYTKEYIDKNFVAKEEGKTLSTNDFNNNYKAAIDSLDKTYLKLSGGTMNGDIHMTTHDIDFTGGRIRFLDSNGEEISILSNDTFSGACAKTNQVGNMMVVLRNTKYNVGDIRVAEGLKTGMYLYCKTAGITAALAPLWNNEKDGETTDGTSVWQSRSYSSTYTSSGENTDGMYLPLSGGALTGDLDMSSHNVLFSTGVIKFYDTNKNNVTATITKDQYPGNAATATKLHSPVHINTVEFDGSKDITIDCIPSTEKGKANGVAILDNNGKVPSSQLPSYVDDVIEVETYNDLPNPGEFGKLYTTRDNSQIYRWSGTTYVNISPSSSTSETTIKLQTPRKITLSNEVTGQTSFDGSRDVVISTKISPNGVKAGAYGTAQTLNQFTVDETGRITKVSDKLTIAPEWKNIINKPTTLEGFGITDRFPTTLPANGGNADTVGHHSPGTSPGNVLVLDNTGKIPVNNIPIQALFSTGMITLWYGSSNAVPKGWHICDGTAGTPDLRDKFIIAAGGKYDFLSTGGEEKVTLTTQQMPSHKHPGSRTDETNLTGTFKAQLRKKNSYATGVFTGYMEYGDDWKSGSAANHVHVVTFNGRHSHSINTSAAGGGQAHNNMPPYIALFYIMKL